MADIKNIKPNQLSGVISGASSILNTAIDLGSINDNYQDDIDQVENQSFSPSSTYSLMNQFNNMNWGDTKSIQDFTGKTGKDYAKGILGATATGATAGATFGPWGALIGGAVGLVGSGIGAITGGIRGSNALDRYKYQLAQAQDFALGNWNTANTELKTNMFDNSLKSFYRSSAYGGELGTHGSDFTNDLRYINVGGTHEQNPNGGVQMGVDEEGTPNLVEEGEVVFNDYVFSDRLKPSKKALNDSLLGDKYFGKTYAEIAEKLAEKSEEMPNDKIEHNTLNANLARLITIQEEQRLRKEQRETNEFGTGGPTKRGSSYVYGNGHVTRSKELADLYYTVTGHYSEIKGNGRVGYVTWDGKVWPNKPAAKRHAREKAEEAWATYKTENGIDREFLDKLDKGQISIGSSTTEVRQQQANYSATPTVPSSETQEQQIKQRAVQTAKEAVARTDTTGAADTSIRATGIKPTVQDGNIIRPDLTNAKVGFGQIPYDRAQNGVDFENQQYYQDFLNYMDSIKDTPEAQAWIDAINAGSFGDMNGYKINSFDDWRRLATDKKVGPVHTATLMAANNWGNTETARRSINNDLMQPIAPTSPMPNNKVTGPKEDIIGNPLNEDTDNDTDGTENPGDEDNNWEGLLRYTPVVGNALGLLANRKDYSDVNRFESMTARPRTVRFTPIGTYIRPNLVAPSEMSTPIQNQMAGERNYISNNSLGNSTAASSYMLASDYLGNARIGAAYLQGKQYNSDQRQRAASYNLGIDQYNSNGAFQEQQANMSLNDYYLRRALASYQMRNNIDMAYNQAKSQNLTALFNNLGNIGLDTFNRNRANEVYPYKYTGWNGDIDFYNS